MIHLAALRRNERDVTGVLGLEQLLLHSQPVTGRIKDWIHDKMRVEVPSSALGSIGEIVGKIALLLFVGRSSFHYTAPLVVVFLGLQ